MIDSIDKLWSIMTVFFTDVVVYQPLFMALILLNSIFAVFYIFMSIFDFFRGARY